MSVRLGYVVSDGQQIASVFVYRAAELVDLKTVLKARVLIPFLLQSVDIVSQILVGEGCEVAEEDGVIVILKGVAKGKGVESRAL